MDTNNKRLFVSKLQNHFKGRSSFVSKDIYKFYEMLEPLIKSTTVNWRVYSLVQAGVISRIGRGKFTLGKERNFAPQISTKIKSLYNKLLLQFPYLNICIWNTSMINELMLHQTGKFYTLVEVDKAAMEPVFYFLKENYKHIFLDPNLEIINHYVLSEKDVIIIKPLTTEAPTQKILGVETVTIEKFLVDIFCDENIFAAQQGSEMKYIFKEAFEKYTVNENKMLRYSDRKRKKEPFNTYLNKVSKFRQQTK